MNPRDRQELADAVARLEQQGFAITVANKIGVPLEALMRRLPPGTQALVNRAVNQALEQCLHAALTGVSNDSDGPHNVTHRALTAATGAVGGFFGIAGLLLELPVSTTLMLRSIAEIARSNGEDLTQPEAALSCLQVFALGRDRGHPESVESAYYATRAALAQATKEAASFIAEKGMAKSGAPALVRFLANIGARFGIEVGEKAAAQLVPIAGAFGGMALNLMFIAHFQRLAEGHFTIRRLERTYGTRAVQQEYELARAALGGSARSGARA